MSLYNVYNLIHVLRDQQNKSVFPVFMLRQLLPRGNAQVFTEAEHHFTRLDTPHGCLAAPCTAAYSILLHILQSTNLDHVTHSTLTFCSGMQPSLSSKMISMNRWISNRGIIFLRHVFWTQPVGYWVHTRASIFWSEVFQVWRWKSCDKVKDAWAFPHSLPWKTSWFCA